ncbi:MAG: hypothetical protein PUE83_09040 [Lachnobacterium sp.]|nr:hypothetical protein [Lachnobacterium sp.]
MNNIFSKLMEKDDKITILDFVMALIASFIGVTIVAIVYGLADRNLSVPIIFSNDGIGGIFAIKNINDGNGFFSFPRLNAPIGETNYTEDFFAQLMVVWILHFFTKNIGWLSYAYWLFTYCAIIFFTYFFIRKIKISPALSIVCSIIYSFLPYHFFRLEHFWLFGYYIVPIVGLLILEIYKQDKIRVVYIILALGIGISGLYYSIFSTFIICFVAFFEFINKKNIKVITQSAIYISCIMLPAIFLSIGLDNVFGMGQSGLVASSRSVGELNSYGLMIFLMFLPIPGHRIKFLSNFTESCYQLLNVTTENYTSMLGFAMSLGCIISLYFVFIDKENDSIVRKFGLINIFIMLLATTGGFDLFIGLFISASIRCYNRMSIFIALFSLAVLAISMQKICYKIQNKYVVLLIYILLMIISILDQTSSEFKKYSSYYPTSGYENEISDMESEYVELNTFFDKIESETELNNIYLLPTDEPAGSLVQLKYIICSQKCNFSYSTQNTEYSMWLRTLENMETNEMIDILVYSKFTGILIEKDSLEERRFNELISESTKILGEPIYNEDVGLYYFSLENRVNDLKEIWGEDKFYSIQEAFELYPYLEVVELNMNNGTMKNTNWKYSITEEEGVYYLYIDDDVRDVNITSDEKIQVQYNTDKTSKIKAIIDLENESKLNLKIEKNINGEVLLIKIKNSDKDKDIESIITCIEETGLNMQTYEVDLKSFCMNGNLNDSSDKIKIEKDNLLYGPYIAIQSGHYQVEIQGDNLENTIYSIGNMIEDDVFNIYTKEEGANKIVFDFWIYEDKKDVEIYLRNCNHDMVINSVRVRKYW